MEVKSYCEKSEERLPIGSVTLLVDYQRNDGYCLTLKDIEETAEKIRNAIPESLIRECETEEDYKEMMAEIEKAVSNHPDYDPHWTMGDFSLSIVRGDQEYRWDGENLE